MLERGIALGKAASYQYFSFPVHYSFLQSGYGVEARRAKGGAELELHGSVRYECGARRVGLSGPALAAQRDASITIPY